MTSAVSTERDRAVLTIHLHRPYARNAVDGPTAAALLEAFESFEADESLIVAVLHGQGGTFCAGADLKALGDPARRNFVEPTVISAVPSMRIVLAAIEGHAVAGGLELALMCDLRVASRSAVLGVFCRRWGVPLIDGGTVRLPRVVGMGRALDLILTGRAVDAPEAQSMGLVNRVVEDGQALAAAQALAAEIAAFPQACMRADRASAHAQWGQPMAQALRQEGAGGYRAVHDEGLNGAARFASGAGRHGELA